MMHPAQTPGGFVKAGDTALWFSPQCVEALLAAKLDPAAFGSYEHVANVNAQASAKCRAWDAASSPQREAAGMTPPTAQERMLAQSGSGHLVQNAVYQNPSHATRAVPPGPGRDDPTQCSRADRCNNVVDGYDSFRAPCAPQMGRAGDGTTENGRYSALERQAVADQRDARGVGQNYPAGERSRDEDARGADFVRTHTNDPAAGQAQARANADAAAAGRGPAAPEGTSSATARPGNPNDPSPGSTVRGNNAADCVNNWREQQMEALRNKSVSDRRMNARNAETTPANQAELAQRRDTLNNAVANESQIRGDIRNAEAAGDPDRHQLYPQLAQAQADRVRAEREYWDFRSAGCAAAQGEWLAAGGGNTTGRVF